MRYVKTQQKIKKWVIVPISTIDEHFCDSACGYYAFLHAERGPECFLSGKARPLQKTDEERVIRCALCLSAEQEKPEQKKKRDKSKKKKIQVYREE